MKTILFIAFIIATLIPTQANAFGGGFYGVAQIGQSNSHLQSNDLSVMIIGIDKSSTDNRGLSGRIGLGYLFNDFFAGEININRIAPTTFINVHGLKGNTAVLKQYTVNFSTKASIPFKSGLELSATASLSAVHQTSPDPLPTNSSVDSIHPSGGCGIGYDINAHFSAELSWNRVFKGNGLQKSIDQALLGIIYYL